MKLTDENLLSILKNTAMISVIAFYLLGVSITNSIVSQLENYNISKIAVVSVFWPISLIVFAIKSLLILGKENENK